MSDKPEESNTNIELLVNQYQETKAPPGFANRVMAHVEEDKKRHPPGIRSFASSISVDVIGMTRNTRFAYVASIALIAIVAVVVVKSIDDKQVQHQIAKQEQPAQVSEPAVKQQLVQIEKSESKIDSPSKPEKPIVVASMKKADELSSKVVITREEHELFFRSPEDTDATSLAVLTDVSDWLTSQKEPETPDISDLPDLSDIENLLSTT